MVAHLSVVGLVAAAGFAGFTGISETEANEPHFAGSAPFVTSVRGAAVESQALSSSQFDTRAASEEESAFLDRGASAVFPGQGEPLPTPVPVDPDATPLAAPDSVGQVAPPATAAPAQPPTVRAAPPPAALVWPVPAGSISQYYHAGHLAIDIAAPYGSTVVAGQSGTVSSAGWRNNGGGYVVSINHGNGMTTIYNHLGSIWVSPGQFVGAGQGIGGVGCTGMCTGPHVHFEVIVNGVIDNPLRYL